MNELNCRPMGKYPSIIHSYLLEWDSEWVLMEMMCGRYPALIDQLNQKYKEIEWIILQAIKAQSTRPSGEDTLAAITWEESAKMQAQELTIEELNQFLYQKYPLPETREEFLDDLPF